MLELHGCLLLKNPSLLVVICYQYATSNEICIIEPETSDLGINPPLLYVDKVNCVQQRSVIIVMTILIKTQSWPDKGGRCTDQTHRDTIIAKLIIVNIWVVLPLYFCVYSHLRLWARGMGPGQYWHLPPNVDTRESCKRTLQHYRNFTFGTIV